MRSLAHVVMLVFLVLSINLISVPIESKQTYTKTTYVMYAIIKDKITIKYGNSTRITRFLIVRGTSLAILKSGNSTVISGTYMKNLDFSMIDGKLLFLEGKFRGVLTDRLLIGVYKLEMRM